MKRTSSWILPDFLQKQSARFADYPAVLSGNQCISYQEFTRKTDELARYLLNLGVSADKPVAICMERSPELLITMWAVLKAGGAYIPLDPEAPDERLFLILEEAQNPLLIIKDCEADKFRPYTGQQWIFGEFETSASCHKMPLVKSNHSAYIIYTSGSTGKPKGVVVEHGSVVAYGNWFKSFCHLKPGQIIDYSSSPAFDFAVTTTLIPLMYGLTVSLCDWTIKKDPARYLEYLAKNKINSVKLTPGYFKILLYQASIHKTALPHLKKIILGGENLASKDCADWLKLYPGHSLFNEYGPTETTVGVYLYQVNKKNINTSIPNIPIGTLVHGSEAWLMDENGQPVAEGKSGELYLGGSCLARGYFNDPVMSARQFIPHPFNREPNARLYKTGDICQYNSEGIMECLGRIDYQIKIRGFRVEPAEIEHCLLRHPSIQSAAVVASELHQKEKVLIAYFTIKDCEKKPEEKTLRTFLKKYLPDYMIPVHLIHLDVLPLNANEKLDRNALPLPDFNRLDYNRPSTRLEKKLADIWSQELGIKPLCLEDNFFDLGGHSLSAARIITTVNYLFGREISLQNFYESPTLDGLSQLINKLPKIKKEKRTKTFIRARQLPLSNFQFTLWLAHLFEPKARKLNICIRKRFYGQPDITRLKEAFKQVLKKHEILSYRVFALRASQKLQKHPFFELETQELQYLSLAQIERSLEESLEEMSAFNEWPDNKFLLRACLYTLKNNCSELHLTIPHIIGDEVSLQIILQDLSDFYLNPAHPSTDIGWREYLETEKIHTETWLKRDIQFWENYLKDASLFSFPQDQIMQNMQHENYSTWQEIPAHMLKNIKEFSMQHHVSLNDALSGVLLKTLHESSNSDPIQQIFCINRVKSTRDDPRYDHTVGCFLNIEPVKIQIQPESDLIDLCKNIHQSALITSPFQKCSNLIKLASIGHFQKQKKRLQEYSIQMGVTFYNLLFPSFKLNPEIIRRGARLNTSKKNQFLININVHSSFFTQSATEDSIFGLKPINIQDQQAELLNIDHFFDVCFLKMDNHKSYMVISANLAPQYRESLAKHFIKNLGSVEICTS